MGNNKTLLQINFWSVRKFVAERCLKNHATCPQVSSALPPFLNTMKTRILSAWVHGVMWVGPFQYRTHTCHTRVPHTVVSPIPVCNPISPYIWMTLLEVANLPLTPATESQSTGSSIKQILLFAIVCVCINILMGYLPSSLPCLSDLKLVIQGSSMLCHHTSPPNNLLTTPVARVVAVVEKLAMEQTKGVFGPPDNVLAIVSNITSYSEWLFHPHFLFIFYRYTSQLSL